MKKLLQSIIRFFQPRKIHCRPITKKEWTGLLKKEPRYIIDDEMSDSFDVESYKELNEKLKPIREKSKKRFMLHGFQHEYDGPELERKTYK